MPIRLAQVIWISPDSDTAARICTCPVGRRLHPDGDLQHAVESHHQPEPEHELEPVSTG